MSADKITIVLVSLRSYSVSPLRKKEKGKDFFIFLYFIVLYKLSKISNQVQNVQRSASSRNLSETPKPPR